MPYRDPEVRRERDRQRLRLFPEWREREYARVAAYKRAKRQRERTEPTVDEYRPEDQEEAAPPFSMVQDDIRVALAMQEDVAALQRACDLLDVRRQVARHGSTTRGIKAAMVTIQRECRKIEEEAKERVEIRGRVSGR